MGRNYYEKNYLFCCRRCSDSVLGCYCLCSSAGTGLCGVFIVQSRLGRSDNIQCVGMYQWYPVQADGYRNQNMHKVCRRQQNNCQFRHFQSQWSHRQCDLRWHYPDPYLQVPQLQCLPLHKVGNLSRCRKEPCNRLLLVANLTIATFIAVLGY